MKGNLWLMVGCLWLAGCGTARPIAPDPLPNVDDCCTRGVDRIMTSLERGDNLSGSSDLLPIEELQRRRARFADVRIDVDRASIAERDLTVLGHLIRAADVMSRLYWWQASEEGSWLRAGLAAARGDYGTLLREYVEINAGGYDRLDGGEPFFPRSAPPKRSTFYPKDLTTAEFEAWIAAHPDDREAFQSPFTLIRREQGALRAIPYSEAYREDLAEAAGHLRAAADSTGDVALARYLRSRADAFESNDYYASDCDWMDLHTGARGESSLVDITIGPYEVYEDDMMNLKAAFEAFVTLVDEAESRKLARIGTLLDEMEGHLPIDDRHRNFSRGKAAPVSVVNVIFTAGDAAKGVQTTAFNLPNDERVRSAKGSKKVLLKNVTEAKFSTILRPIAERLLEPARLPFVTADAFFNFILLHEVSHGIGPGILSLPDGTKTTVNQTLRETYSVIEECKADVLSVFNTDFLIQNKTLPATMGPQTEATYLAGIFRSVRFGAEEAHGKANIMQFNALREAGAFRLDPATGRFDVDRARFLPAITALAERLLKIEAEGDVEAARKLIAQYGSVPEQVRQALSRLGDIPVDIRPVYSLAAQLRGPGKGASVGVTPGTTAP